MNKSNKLPVFIVTGFLGSGKTTLLQKALQDPSMQHTAVLVNEFGKVGLDHHLLQRLEEKTILLGGGCMCCSTREDLVKGLMDLLNQVQRGGSAPINNVIIETTGLADPAPIMFTILSHPVLQHHFYVESVLVTVDAVNGSFHLRKQPESTKQAIVGDKIIITKTDIAAPKEVERLFKELRLFNPNASILTAIHGAIDTKNIFVLNGGIDINQSLLTMQEQGVAAGLENHVQTVRSVSVTFEKPLDWNAFGLWLSMLLHARGEEIMRVKGMVDTGEQGPTLLNGVQHIIHPPVHFKEWPSADHRSRLVFIMRHIQPQELLDSLEAFQLAFEYEHNMPTMEVLL